MKKYLSLLGTCYLLTFAIHTSAKGTINPVNPNASVEARNLLKYIYKHVEGKKVLAGHHEYNFDSMNFMEIPNKITGKYSAIYGCELGMTSGETPERAEQIRLGVVQKAVKWWNSRGIVTLCWHESVPGSAVQTFKNTQKRISQAEFDELLKPGTQGYNLLIAEMDQIAVYLKMLNDAKVPVLWRPYHEMNGGWFWWGKKNNFAKLWDLLYDRLTNYHKLNNLIWVFGPNCPINPNIAPYSNFYPGSSKVDMLVFDAYVNKNEDFKAEWQEDLVKLADGKPVAIGECGMLPTASQFKGIYNKLTYFMTWRENLTQKNTKEQILELYKYKRIITRDEVPDLK